MLLGLPLPGLTDELFVLVSEKSKCRDEPSKEGQASSAVILDVTAF